MSLKPSRALFHVALLCMAVAAGVLWLRQGGTLQRVELAGLDDRVRMERAAAPAPDGIAVVLIDEASLKTMNRLHGRFPWPHSVYADLLDFLDRGHPRAVIFDLPFAEEQPDAAGTGPGAGDRALIAATRAHGRVYYTARFFDDDQGRTGALPPDFVSRFGLRRAGVPGAGGAASYALPFAPLYRSAAGVGVSALQPDADGLYRRLRLFQGYGGAVFPSLAAAALPGLDRAPVRQDRDMLTWAGGAVPLDAGGRYLVNPYGRMATYSFGKLYASLQALRRGDRADVLVDPRAFTGRLVFVGVSAAGLGEARPTALSAATPEVMLYADAAGNLLHGDFLRPAPPYVTVLLVTLLALATGVGIAPARRTAFKLLLPLALGSIYAAWAYWRFRHGAVYDISAPLLAIAGAWLAVSLYGTVTGERERRRVRELFAQYLSPALLREVVDRDARAAPGGGRRSRVTVLFCDIRGFTSISERIDAQKVVELLNIHFSAMAEVVFAHGGTLDKFIGDALMAYWGAPEPCPDHAHRAVAAALEMRRRLAGVNAALRERGYPAIEIGIGVHTGDAVLGNIGSRRKLDFTIIGDNVNTASRLERLSGRYGQAVVVSDVTRGEIRGAIPCAVLDKVKVRGKDKPMTVYTPLAGPQDSDAQRAAAAAAAELLNAAFDFYLARDWRRALAIYRTLPDSDLGRRFAARCAAYLDRAPNGAWDGSITVA